jgi:hypothetical protein
LFFDALQVELHNKYDLIPRPIMDKNDNHPPSKNLPVNQSKDKEKESVTIAQKIDTQEQVKGRNEHKDIDKIVQPFNIEHELGNIKIPVPLVELSKNPSIKGN